MKKNYLQPLLRKIAICTEKALMQSTTSSASGQNITIDTESGFDDYFGS